MSNKKIIFVHKRNLAKKIEWSGTVNNLFEQLSKYYDIDDLIVNETLLEKVKRRANNFLCAKIFNEDFYLKLCKRAQRLYKRKYGNKKQIVMQFWEFDTPSNASSFIFQDLCVKSVYDLKKNDFNTYKVTEFSGFSDSDMHNRIQAQQKLYNDCKAIFTMGQWMRDYIINECGIEAEKVYAVGGGINIDANKYCDYKKSRNKILFVGRNFKRKGGELVVEAFKYLKKNIKFDVELYIAGCAVNEWENEDGIIFVGDISTDELVDYYNKCDILCMPSYFEPYGLVFGEALCFGLPCIGRECNAMPEFIQDGVNGYLIDRDDVVEFAKLMNNLLNDDQIFENVLKNREKYLEKYSWDKVGETIYKIIEDKVSYDATKSTY